MMNNVIGRKLFDEFLRVLGQDEGLPIAYDLSRLTLSDNGPTTPKSSLHTLQLVHRGAQSLSFALLL
jgi:hypothetical protein